MNKYVLIICVAYFLLVSIFLIWHGSFFSPDQFFVMGLLLTLLIGKSKQFIKDWSMPITLFLGYDYLRGLVPKLTQAAHIYPMINFDKLFFGSIPAIKLQSLLYSNELIHWYDYMATVFYMSHFIVPMIVAFIFWFRERKYFTKYSLALLILSYSAFITYIFFPAMPPWMAAQKNIIPPVAKIMDQVFANFAYPINLPSVYQFVGVNLVAAVPSLHAAYPWLTFLFLFIKIKKWAIYFIPYVLGVWFSIIYLGEHYVFDILIGVLYATFSFALVAVNRTKCKFPTYTLVIDQDAAGRKD